MVSVIQALNVPALGELLPAVVRQDLASVAPSLLLVVLPHLKTIHILAALILILHPALLR